MSNSSLASKASFLVLLLLALNSCADGKPVWKLEEAKKTNESASTPSGSENADTMAQSLNQKGLKSGPRSVGMLKETLIKCYASQEDSLLKGFRELLFENESKKADFSTKLVTKTFPASKLHFLVFTFEAKLAVDKQDNESDEVKKHLMITNEFGDPQAAGKINIDITDDGEEIHLISKTGLPLFAYEQTVRAPGRNKWGRVQEETRLVDGIRLMLPKDYVNEVKFEVVNDDKTRSDVDSIYNAKLLINCLSDALEK